MAAWTEILALGAGVLGTLGVQSYFSCMIERVAAINDHMAEIATMERLACDYWINVSGPENVSKPKNECRDLAAQVRGAFHAATCFEDDIDVLLTYCSKEYRETNLAFYRAMTGGLFDTSEADVNYGRVVEIMTLGITLRSMLRKARRRVFWAR